MPKPTTNSTTPVLAQGAVFEICAPTSVDASGNAVYPTDASGNEIYSEVPGLETIPQMGAAGEFVDITSIDELTKVFTAGIKTPAAFELIFRDIGSNAVHDSLQTAGTTNTDALKIVKVKVTYRTGRVLDVDVALNGFSMGEAAQGNAVQTALVSGQQNSEPVWSKVA